MARRKLTASHERPAAPIQDRVGPRSSAIAPTAGSGETIASAAPATTGLRTGIAVEAESHDRQCPIRAAPKTKDAEARVPVLLIQMPETSHFP